MDREVAEQMESKRITRRDAIRAGALGAGAVAMAGRVGTAAAAGTNKTPVTINMLTWNDHYDPKRQLPAIAKETGITVRPTLGSDDGTMFIKARQSHGEFAVVSADALWVPYYVQQKLAVPFDIKSFPVSKQLFPVGLEVPFWKASGGLYMGYPRAWSALRIYYNPKYVHPAPTSWDVLLDPKYKGKYVRENQPTDIVAEAGLATGAKDPYNMNAHELSRAKQFLQSAKPAFLDLVSQNTGVVNALTNETAWFTSENLGTDIRVKKAGGPTIKAAIPKEGVVGWLDAEMKMIGPDEDRFEQFINAWGQAEWIPPLFKEFEEAWFNEKAYKLLVNMGLGHLADAVGYNDPEGALKAHLKGPQKNPGAYIQVFNEVFGA